MNIERLLNLVAPHYCIACGEEGSLLCGFCSFEDVFEKISTCYRCNALTSDFATCSSCKPSTGLKQVWVCAEYSGVVKELIRRHKFERVKQGAEVLAGILDSRAPLIGEHMLVTYVPTATQRIRTRGYDHAKLISSQFAKRRNVEFMQLLQRTTQNRQVGSDKTTRRTQLDGAFRAVRTQNIVGMDVLIIDDVVTTGATLEECTKVLKTAGAKSVIGLVVAKK